MNTGIMSKKFGIGDILTLGIRIFSNHWKNILMVTLVIFVPLNIILAFFPANNLNDPIESSGGLQALSGIFSIISSLVAIITYFGIAYIVERALKDQAMEWQEALKLGFSKWGVGLLTSLLAGLILLGLTLLLVVPGIIWGVYYTFFLYVVALRNIDGKKALDYSKALVKGQWWRTFGILFVLGLISAAVNMLLGWTLGSIAGEIVPLRVIFDCIISGIGSIFFVFNVVFFLNTDFLKNPSPAPAEPPAGEVVP